MAPRRIPELLDRIMLVLTQRIMRARNAARWTPGRRSAARRIGITQLIEFLWDRPRGAAALGLASVALALVGASRIELDAGSLGLLRPDAPEVISANHVRDRTGADQLVVALSGIPPAALDQVATELARRAEVRPDIAYAHASLDTSFFEDRAVWLMDDSDLEALSAAAEELRALLEERFSGFSLGLDADRQEEITRRIRSIERRALGRHRGLTLASADGVYRFVLIVPTVRVTDVDRTAPLLEGLQGLVDDLAASHPGLEARFTGKLALVQEHQQMLERDLAVTSIAAFVLCVIAMVVFLRSVRAPLAIGGAVALASLWTLGLAGFFAGSLNVISSLLFPVLAGLGVDFGIHLAIRYRQVRPLVSTPKQAMQRAVRATVSPAIVGALTTAAAFAALACAELRGLVQLGWLAAAGILCSLTATYLVVPALLMRLDRGRSAGPIVPARPRTTPPRWVSFVIVFSAVGLTLAATASLEGLRFENDYRLLSPDTDSDVFFEFVDSELDIRFDPTIIVVAAGEDDLRATRAILERRQRAADSRIDHIIGLDDFLPNTSERRRRAVARLRQALAHPIFDRVEDERIDRARRVAAQDPWAPSELPAWVRDRFMTYDGEGAVLLVYGDEPIQSDTAALRWSAELDVVRAELDRTSIAYTLSNEALLPAWVYKTILDDGPRVVGIAGCAVALLVLLYFVRLEGIGGLVKGAFVIGVLAAGIVVMLGVLAAAEVRLTTFNLAVFPCVIGIAVDDHVHLAHRIKTRSTTVALRETGPALVLTSLTTLIGFGVTVLATHHGLRTVAPAALIAIACTTLAALVLFPALVRLAGLERRS